MKVNLRPADLYWLPPSREGAAREVEEKTLPQARTGPTLVLLSREAGKGRATRLFVHRFMKGLEEFCPRPLFPPLPPFRPEASAEAVARVVFDATLEIFREWARAQPRTPEAKLIARFQALIEKEIITSAKSSIKELNREDEDFRISRLEIEAVSASLSRKAGLYFRTRAAMALEGLHRQSETKSTPPEYRPRNAAFPGWAEVVSGSPSRAALLVGTAILCAMLVIFKMM